MPVYQTYDIHAFLTNMVVKTLDYLGIFDQLEQKSRQELHEATKQHFLETIEVKNSRFVVRLLWIEDHLPLPDTKELPLRKLDSTINKLRLDGLYEEYDKVFQEWLEEDIIEKVPDNELYEPTHYLPHRHVVKESSTTKTRPSTAPRLKEALNQFDG